jgi:hypothetical protein
MGHSLGALLQTLVTSLFPETPRAANVLMAFNNKPAQQAIPLFNEVVIPMSKRYDTPPLLTQRLAQLRDISRDAVSSYATSQYSPRWFEEEVYPVLWKGVEVLEQVSEVLQEIASMCKKQDYVRFTPSPLDTNEVG